jgi:hypothetical protein
MPDIRTSVRLPQSIHSAVLQMAEKERRSFNAQIIRMIEEYLERHGVTTPPPATKD